MKTLFTAAAVFLSATIGTTASAQNVGIATSNPGSLFHNIGTAVANAANEAGLNTTIQPATSPNQFIPFVDQGGIEFGVANLQEVAYAVTGDAWWEGRTNPNLRIVAHLMPLVEAIFVRADSDIMKVSDLTGQPMTDGYTAQNTILPQLSAFYATAGMTRDDVEKVSVASVVAGADAFMAGDTVGFIFAHGAGKVREADAAPWVILRALGSRMTATHPCRCPRTLANRVLHHPAHGVHARSARGHGLHRLPAGGLYPCRRARRSGLCNDQGDLREHPGDDRHLPAVPRL